LEGRIVHKIIQDTDGIIFQERSTPGGDPTLLAESFGLESVARGKSIITKEQEAILLKNLQSLYKECLEEIRKAPNCLESIAALEGIFEENRIFSFSLLMSRGDYTNQELENKFYECVQYSQLVQTEIETVLEKKGDAEKSAWTRKCSNLSIKAFDRFEFTTAAVDYLAPLYIKSNLSQFEESAPLGSELEASAHRINGLFQQIANLRDTLFASQEYLLKKIVKSRVSSSNWGKGLLMDDLMQEARLSLYVAMHRFDTDRGIRFNAYYTNWVTAAVFAEIYDHFSTVRVPRYLLKALNRQDKFGGVNKSENGSYNNDLTPQMHAGMSTARRVVSMKSLDSFVAGTDDNLVLSDTIAAKLEEVEFASDQTTIQRNREEALSTIQKNLTDREFFVLKMRTGFEGGKPKTLSELSGILGLSTERIRQIYVAGLEKAKQSLQSAWEDLGL
jgi:RNA polymerase sigma factor (sigma-70 family)